MSIASEKFMEIVNELGMTSEEQSAFYKISVGTRAAYVAKTKKVSRGDFSGFEGIKHPAVKRLTEQDAKDLKLGKVRAQLDFSKTDDRVLEAFRGSLEMMRHLAEAGDEAGETPTVAKKSNKRQRGKAIKGRAQARKAQRAHAESEHHHAGA